MLWCFLVTVLLACVAMLVAVLFVHKRLEGIPQIDVGRLETYGESQILDRNGNVIWEPTGQQTVKLAYEEIPEFYKTAIVAIEDEGFWESDGISVKGIVNMVYSTIRNKLDPSYPARGGSTIEQQLIKNRYFNGGEGYDVTTRKIQEIFLALQMDENFTKEEILTFYVNALEFSEGSTGIGAIMRTYFGKTPADYQERTPETIAELSYLAGLSQAPSAYNLYDNPDGAKTRCEVVLKVLLDNGQITKKEYDEARAFDLQMNLRPRNWEAEEKRVRNLAYKAYTDGVLLELEELGYDVENVSMTVRTYLNPDLFWQVTNLVRDPKYYLDGNQQSGVAVVDTNGIVVALVGTRSPEDEFNRALSGVRSSGSSMKPFTAYAPLLQYFGSKYNTASTFDTAPYPYPNGTAVMYNYSAISGYYSMRQCLRYSYNTPVGRIDDEILGPKRMKQFLQGVGLDVQESYSAVDGIGLNVSPLQSAAAYNALNTGGLYTRPRFVQSITFQDGSTREIEPRTNQAMNPSVAYVVTQMLRGVPGGDGTANAARIREYEGYAGKTGTTGFDKSSTAPMTYGNGDSDVWYCSYTNGGYAISVWCGYDVPNESPRIPAYYKGQQYINRDLQRLLNGDRDVLDWERPGGVEVLLGSGLYAHYKVTDSFDGVSEGWPDVSGYGKLDITKARADGAIDEAWESEESDAWFGYYKDHGAEVSDIIEKDVYEKLR